MAFNKTPTNWIPNYSSNGSALSIPLASFPELTVAEADTVSGDIRKILFAIMEQLIGKWNSTNTADRPEKMTVSRSTGVNELNGEVTKQFVLTFVTNVLSQEVVDES